MELDKLLQMGLLLPRGEKREEPRRVGRGQGRAGGRIGHIHTTHTGLSSCSEDSGGDHTKGGRMAVHQPPLFSLVSPLTLPAVIQAPVPLLPLLNFVLALSLSSSSLLSLFFLYLRVLFVHFSFSSTCLCLSVLGVEK